MANQQDIRESIQAYLLGTLSDANHAQVEASIAQDPEWQAILEEEVDALAMLDSLESVTPPIGLTERTLANLDTTEESPKGFWSPLVFKSSWAVAILFACFSILIPLTRQLDESQKHSDTADYLKQMGLVMKMYANESAGNKYPPLAPYEDLWMFDISTVYPEYITDLSLLVSPFLPDHDELVAEMYDLAQREEKDWRRITEIAARGFSYTGWTFEEDELEVLVVQRQQLASSQYDTDLETAEGETIHRLREGVERFLITDINNPLGSPSGQSEIPVLFESLESLQHKTSKTGAIILYLDGHVEYHPLAENALSTPSVLKHLLPKD